MNVDMNEQYRKFIGKNVLWLDNKLKYHRGKLQYFSEQLGQWVVREKVTGNPWYVPHLSLLSTEYTKKVSWANCNWAPAHILRIVTQDNLPLYNKCVLTELKLKGYFFKGGLI